MKTADWVKRGSAGLLLTLMAITPALAQQRGNIHWSGDVDDRAEIRIRGDRVWIDRQNMAGVKNAQVRMRGSLPMHWERLQLNQEEGRGQIRLVQQPRPENDYTAIVRIRDTEAGRGHYAFTIRWNDNNGRWGNSNRRWNNDNQR